MADRSPASNTRAHLAYLRMLPDKRLMFGGRGDTTGIPAGGEAMRRFSRAAWRGLFPALQTSRSRIRGAALSQPRRVDPGPRRATDDPTVSFAFGCHGNGVAFMTWAGRELSKRIAGIAQELPAPLRGLPPSFPLPGCAYGNCVMLARAYLEDAFL